MKKLLIALAAVLVTVATHAQGTVQFATITGTVNAPVTLVSRTGAGAGPSYSAALYYNNAGTWTLIPSSVTTFLDGTDNPEAMKYINPISTVEVPGAAIGGSATLRMRAWLTAAGSYDAASPIQRGESGDLLVTGLGGGAVTPADLPASFDGFVIPIPEPSTLALGVLGAAGLLLRRRK